VGGVVDAGDFDARATHAVGDNVGRFGDDQFPRAGDPAGGPELRVFGEELFDAVEDVEGDALGGCRVVLGDVSAKRFGGRGSIPETRGGSYLTHLRDALVGSTLARIKGSNGLDNARDLPLVGVKVGRMEIHNDARARLESGRNPPELAKPGHGLIDVKPGKVMSTGVRLTLLLQHLPVEQATKIELIIIIMLIGGHQMSRWRLARQQSSSPRQ